MHTHTHTHIHGNQQLVPPASLTDQKNLAPGKRKLILDTHSCTHSVGLQKVKYMLLTYILYILLGQQNPFVDNGSYF